MLVDFLHIFVLKVIDKGFDSMKILLALLPVSDCRKPHQIILIGSRDKSI